MTVPAQPKLYHIVHVDRLASIVGDGALWCDAEAGRRQVSGTTIGFNHIKKRRLELDLKSNPGLKVGACVPFYFCPRSVMLFLIHKGNSLELSYRGGQGDILHLELDLHAVVQWASAHAKRWAFTLSNAGSYYFEDRCRLDQLDELDWAAIAATSWQDVKGPKQAEFLLEHSIPS